MMSMQAGMIRRRTILGAAASLALARRAAAAETDTDDVPWHGTDVTGQFPYLAFNMTNAATGQAATEVDVRNKVVMLSFGDTASAATGGQTLAHAASAISGLGTTAADIRYLFVTLAPDRDTQPVLARYVAAFGPAFIGLRGDQDELTAFTSRYTAVGEATPSPGVFVFDRFGNPRVIEASLATPKPDIAGTQADLRYLLGMKLVRPGLISRLISSL